MPQIGAFVPMGIALFAIAACVGTFAYQKHKMDSLRTEVAAAKEESQKLAPQIARIKQLQREREQLDQRLDAITILDQERYFRVHLLSEISRTIPQNTWLTKVTETGPGQLEVQGITFSNFIVADFLRDLNTSEHYRTVDLVGIQRGRIKDFEVLEFTITAAVGQSPVEVAAEL
jgi:type IV pilus assembly protein PilN